MMVGAFRVIIEALAAPLSFLSALFGNLRICTNVEFCNLRGENMFRIALTAVAFSAILAVSG